MKLELPGPNGMEWRVTALLLGELPTEEAATLREQIDRDPQLALLYRRLEHAMGLVREVAALPQVSPETFLRMSDDRRSRLQAHFRTATLPVTKREDRPWVGLLALAAVVMGLLSLPLFLVMQSEVNTASTKGIGPLAALSSLAPAAAVPDEPAVISQSLSAGAFHSRQSGNVDFSVQDAALGLPSYDLARADVEGRSEAVRDNQDKMRRGVALPMAGPGAQAVDNGVSEAPKAVGSLDRVEEQVLERLAKAPAGVPQPGAPSPVLGDLRQWADYDNDGTLLMTNAAAEVSQTSNYFFSYQEPGLQRSGGDQLGFINRGRADAVVPSGDLGGGAGYGGFAGVDGSKASTVGELSLFKEKAVTRETFRGQLDVKDQDPAPQPAPARTGSVLQPEVLARENAFSTFSLNVSDVSYKLASASLQNGIMPEPGGIRSEEFLNALDYHDPAPVADQPLAFAWERARWPFAQNRDLLRLSLKTAASGRGAGQRLNLVVLLDNSGSMERADRVHITQNALRVLMGKLQPEDRFSLITFARTPRVWFDGLSGDQALKALNEAGPFAPEGGTNLEEALRQAYGTALAQYVAGGNNRVVLLTDGAANLGDVDPEALKAIAVEHRQQGIALDCFGVGWEGYNDDLLETLSRNADGRYGFLNDVEKATTEFASQLAGTLQVFASDVKVQVQFNPERVKAYRQVGYARHQLTKEQFRDNKVDAAELGAAESGTAAYIMEVDSAGQGPLATVRARYRDPRQNTYAEQEWVVPFTGAVPALDGASASLKLAGVAVGFSEWLANSSPATEINPDRLLSLLQGVPQAFAQDPRPQALEAMLRQAKSISGQ